MTIAEAKQVRIVDFLAQLGHHAQHIKSEQYWYFSPLRNERTPSFKVNDRINEWYDFGEATGGDLVEPRTRMPTAPPRPVEAEMKDVIVIPLRHHALFSYLQSRLIDADIGRMYCKEVHYELRGRHYFALAFGNTSGGYEVRNAYYKGCLNNKDISLIRHLTEETQENVCVFEGFMDFLSYMTLKLAGDRTVCLAMPCDYLVMNSVNNLKKTLARLQEYSVIHCYLDNDLAGQRTTETIAGMYDGRVSDESCHYAEYKDLNDYLRGKKR